MDTLEKITYALNHNLPVRRDLIYELAPKVFNYEIGELKRVQEARYEPKQIRLMNKDGLYINYWDGRSGGKAHEIKEKNKPMAMKLLEESFESEGAMMDFIEVKVRVFL